MEAQEIKQTMEKDQNEELALQIRWKTQKKRLTGGCL